MLQQEDGSWIDARTLHNELGVKKKFADWIKTKIDKYEFIENDDYKLDFPKRGNQTSHGGDRKSREKLFLLNIEVRRIEFSDVKK